MKVENFTAIIIEIQLNPQDLLNDLVKGEKGEGLYGQQGFIQRVVGRALAPLEIK